MAVLTKITSRTLADDSVTSSHIQADVIAAGDIAANAVDTAELAAGAVTAAKMDADTGVATTHHKVPVYANDSARNTAISSPSDGMIIYNTAETALQQYNGAWSSIAPAPVITSTSGTINEDTNTTLTVNGSQFIAGMGVKLINASTTASITGHTSLSYTLVSSSQITVPIPSATSNITPGLAVKVSITKAGMEATSANITVSEDPNWTTGAGTVATVSDSLGTSQTVATLAASAGAGGGTLNYASDDNTLDTTYFALNLTSGVITTHASNALTGLTSGGNVTEAFNANAKISGDATKNTVRAFNIIVNKAPATTGESPFAITIGGTPYLVYPFRVMQAGTSTPLLQYTPAMTTGDKTEAKLFGDAAADVYTFTLYNNTNVEVLMIGGGGGSGSHHAGGSGAGGALDTAGTPVAWTAGTFTVTVGAGGENPDGWNIDGNNGVNTSIAEGTGGLNSSHTSIIAKGGGAGNRNSGPGGTAVGQGATPPWGGCGGGGSYGGYPGGNSNQQSFTGYTKYGTNGGANGNNGGDYGGASGGGVDNNGQSWSSATVSAPGGLGRSIIFGLSQTDSNSIMAGTGVGENKLDGTNYYYGGGGGGSTYGGNDFDTGIGGKGGGGRGLDLGTGWTSLYAGGHNTGNDTQANWSCGQAHTGGGGGGMDRISSNASDGPLTPWGGSGFVLIKIPA